MTKESEPSPSTRPARLIGRWAGRGAFVASLPERAVRALSATAFGGAQEAAQLVLPRMVRRSRFYEATARNALRIAIELVGGVEPAPGDVPAGDEPQMSAGRVAAKKVAGNVVEFGSVAAFGFSPLWLLAGASDVLNGTRVYLHSLEEELTKAGVLAPDTHFGSLDQLLGALEGTTGTTASTIDLPPLELAELKRSVRELRDNATSLPTPNELAALFNGLVRTARQEDRSLLEVSSGVGLAFLVSAKKVPRTHLVVPYGEDWRPVRQEGFGAYAARVSGPYRDAVSGHFDPGQRSFTERSLHWLRRPRGGRRLVRFVRERLPRRK
ncbi:MAG: hypothetical protein ACKVT1_18875 [Dehalococcoidia bacterium]